MPLDQTARKPEWLKIKPPGGDNYLKLKGLLRELKLHTVCEEAACPNVSECWGGGTATVMLMGDTCTRGCKFCHVKSGNPKGELDAKEPENVARAISELALTYVVLTSVDRDDLPDGGAAHIAQTVRNLKALRSETLVEILTPDFRGDLEAVRTVMDAGPDVFAHNLETVESLQKKVRDGRCSYKQSLDVLAAAKERRPKALTKSSLMVGLGETEAEMAQAMDDLRAVGVQILTIGQYLRPSNWHIAVEEYVAPEIFKNYEAMGLAKGFLCVPSGPLVRSSYRAGEKFIESMLRSQGS
ncbi:lipoyl synthase [bacterium]|nr:lipoyl synthase [bacterium]